MRLLRPDPEKALPDGERRRISRGGDPFKGGREDIAKYLEGRE
jgi:hypothetical protein